MNRQKLRKSYDNICPDEAARERMLGNILSKASEIPPAGKDDMVGHKKMRTLILVAIIAVSMLLMGSAVIIRLTLATAPEYPLIEPDTIPAEHIHLSVSNVTATSMRIYCSIDGITDGVNDIFILGNGPFTIEQQTENGWVLCEAKTEDPTWDPDRIRTKGSTDWLVNWAGLYGALPAGTYRFTTTVLEGNVPVTVEFMVPQEQADDLSNMVNEILESEFYHIRYTTTDEFGSTENLSRDEKTLIESEYANKVWREEYWSAGENILYLSYRNDHIWTGMMLKDGIKYQLDHEEDDRTNPVSGWSPWPDGDMFWLTQWASLANADVDTLDIEYHEDGGLARVVRTVFSPRFDDSYDVEVTHREEWVFLADNPETIAEKIAEQNTDTARPFSWEADIHNLKSLDVNYKNTVAEPVTTATAAVKRAMNECSVEYDKILVYRDEKAQMWKVEFQIEYGYQGYQFIYLNDEGITQMVSALGSKVPEWKNLYPDP